MRHKIVLSIVLLFATTFIINSQTVSSNPDTRKGPATNQIMPKISVITIKSGSCGVKGNHMTWKITTDSTLTVSGTGEMAHFTSPTIPWADYKDYIKTIIIEDTVMTIGDYAFSGLSKLTSIVFLSKIEQIGQYAFSFSELLPSITIPSTVNSIGYCAFYCCFGLKSFTCEAETPPTVPLSTFKGVATDTLYVPEISVEAYKSSNWGDYFRTILTVGSSAGITGDVNGDGTVNITDAVWIINYTYKAAPAGFNVNKADVNADSKVNLDDAQAIFNMLFETK